MSTGARVYLGAPALPVILSKCARTQQLMPESAGVCWCGRPRSWTSWS